MSALVAMALCGAATAALFYVLLMICTPASLLDRIKDSDLPSPDFTGRLGRWLEVRTVVQQTIGRRLERSEQGRSLQQKLLRSGLAMWPAEWLGVTLGASLVGGALLWLRLQWLPALGIGAVIGCLGAQMVLAYLVRRRDRAFDKQLGPALLALSNSVKAGHTFTQALALAGDTAQAPMSVELSRTVHEIQLGIPLHDALQRMVDRNQSMDLRLVALAVQVQAQVGGNLAEILTNIERTIRDRIRIKGEISTLTAQAKVSGWILIALPFALGGILTVIAPGYFGPMLSRPLGNAMLGFGLFAMACGYGIIRRIVNVKI
jgi:tight adherence protein B